MDHRSLSNLLLRLTGVIIVISSALPIPSNIVGLVTSNGVDSIIPVLLISAIAALLPVLVGLALLWFPGTISNRLIGATDGDISNSICNHALQKMAFSALGLYFISNALFDAVYWFARLKLYYSVIADLPASMNAPAIMPNDFAGIASTAIQLVVGFVLLFGSSGINSIVVKLRG